MWTFLLFSKEICNFSGDIFDILGVVHILRNAKNNFGTVPLRNNIPINFVFKNFIFALRKLILGCYWQRITTPFGYPFLFVFIMKKKNRK